MKKRDRFLLFFISAVVISGAGVYAGRDSGQASFSDFAHVFNDAFQSINERYLHKVNPRDLLYGAIEGMLRKLDADSEFLTPEELMRVRAETEGEFVGIGAKVSIDQDGLRIISVIRNSPAFEAGLEQDDLIVSVDGKSFKEVSHAEVFEMLKGKPGSFVDVGVKAKGAENVISKRIRRTGVDIPNVTDAQIIAPRVGYVRIVEFGEKTRDDLASALKRLRDGSANRFILDVRDNPGGTLDAAVQILELFLSRGDLLVTTVGREENESFQIFAKVTGPYSSAPLAVLIDEGSASASEVLAGALRDHGRAKLFGTRSFGKASVQALLTLRDGSAIRITTAEYFTPNKTPIDRVGLEPDFSIDDEKEQLSQAVSYLENLSIV